MKKIRDFIILLVVILSIPMVIKKCDFKGGSVVVKATIIEITNCPKLDRCFRYLYEYKGHAYEGETSAFKGLSVGSEIKVEVSIKNPKISYIKR